MIRGGRAWLRRRGGFEVPKGGNCMPPSGAALGENTDKEGDDWKCRRVLGRLKAGVEGATSDEFDSDRLVVPRPGVEIMSPSLLDFRFGGLGGTINEGDAGAEIGCEDSTTEAVEMASLGSCAPGLVDVDMFRERFFMFRTFLPGDSGRVRPGRVRSELGGGSIPPFWGDWPVDLKDRKDVGGVIETADSGDELGEGSVTDEESSVEIVVVGDESVDSEFTVEVLSRCCGCGGKQSMSDVCLFVMISVLLRSLVVAAPSSLLSFISEFSPNTDINDGNEANNACVLSCIGILDDRVLDNRRFVETEIGRSRFTILGSCKCEKGSTAESLLQCRDGDDDARAVYDLLRHRLLAFCL